MRYVIHVALLFALILPFAANAETLTPAQYVAVRKTQNDEWNKLITIHLNHKAAACPSRKGIDKKVCDLMFDTIVKQRQAQLEQIELEIAAFDLPEAGYYAIWSIANSSRFNEMNNITNAMWFEAIKRFPADAKGGKK